MDPASPGRPPSRTARALAGWTALVLILHLAGLWGLGQTLPAPSARPEPTRAAMEVVGQLELADPLPVGPAAPQAEAASPRRDAESRVPLWVPVPAPEPVLAPDPAPPASAEAPVGFDPPRPEARPTPELEALPVTPPVPQAESPVTPSPSAPPTAGPLAQADRTDPPQQGPAEAAGLAATALPEPTASAGSTPSSPAARTADSVMGPAGLVASAPPFEWPPSTRLAYSLTGQYRGEIQGQAQVEWLLAGSRYEVHVDIVVGLRIAPLISRRMTSQGLVGARGLAPDRYDETTRVAFREPRQATVRLGTAFVSLADGRSLPAPVTVQDSASQFIQLAYRFATEPGLLQAGAAVELPLALPRRLDIWTYDVVGEEVLPTPFGPLEAVHLRPRPLARAGDVLTAEIWFAPRLRYLPVRIRIQQGPDTFVDLLIERLPDVLAAARPASVAGGASAVSPAASR